MIDEASYLLPTTGSKTDEGKMEDLLREDLKSQLDDIARLGRAAGICLVLTANRVESRAFPKNFKEHFGTRIAFGRMQSFESELLLGSDKSKHWAGAIKGRGYFQQFGEGYDFQGYFIDKDLGL
jgi:DNA segregation ATPase FtsK/SpoIIIE-like protein